MSYFDAVVYSKLAKSSGGITQAELDAALEAKYDKTGGAITGDVAITGNLTVSGTTTTEKEKQLLVEDNVIVTNANKVALQTLLSGLAINKNADATYGIMYDPTDDTVKFGEGTLDESNKFVFKAGEGRPLAVRADSSQFADGYLVKWDENTKSFVRANLKEDNVSKKISGITFSKNASSVNFDMDKGMSLVNMGEITYADQSKGAISTGIDIPIIPGNGVIMDATEVANHVTVKVDPEHSVYMADTPTAENAIPMYAKSSKSWIGLPSTPSATASSVATRDANGRMQVGAPAVGGDVANKAYVDGQTPKVGTQTNKNNLTDIEYLGETDIPATPEIGKEYAVTDLISYSDLDSDLQGKIDATVTKAYVDTAVSNKQDALSAGTGIDIADSTIKITDKVARLESDTPASYSIPVYVGVGSIGWAETTSSTSATANTLVARTAKGIVRTATPEADTDAATKAYVDAAIVAEGPASTIVTLSAPDEAVNGTLTEDELAKLQASDNASIMFAHKKYDLGGKGHQEGYLTYTHAGYENNVHLLESITITISTRAWVLNATEVMDEEEIKAAIAPMIPAVPTWKTTAPTTEADKAKVQFTKVTIATTDETNFPGMNGRYAIVPGFTNDGFHYGTVVCSQTDPAYEFPFIGSITSEMAGGTVIKPSVAPTYVSVVDPQVTFTYEYLW